MRRQLKQHRAMATRHDKLAVRYEATLTIAAINQWLRALRTRPSLSFNRCGVVWGWLVSLVFLRCWPVSCW